MDHLELDTLDVSLLEILKNDSNKTFTEISQELHVSDATIHLRVDKLMKRGIIRKFTVDLDYHKLGYQITAFIELKIAPGTIDTVLKVLENLDGVIEIHELHSHCDILVKVRLANLDELRQRVVLGIRKVLKQNLLTDDVYTVLRVVKDDSELPVIPHDGDQLQQVKAIAEK